MARELILKLGKKITDRVDVKLGMTKLDENSPEYYGLASVVTDEMAELALAMKVRVPTTPAEIGKKVGKDPVYVEQLFDQMSMIGLLEYNWENADHHKQWTLPIFVPGSAELMNMNLQQVETHPEIAQFFERMSFLPLTKITCMVPPGGEGHPGHERVGRCRAHLPLAEKVRGSARRRLLLLPQCHAHSGRGLRRAAG